jgi:hypothetical protein
LLVAADQSDIAMDYPVEIVLAFAEEVVVAAVVVDQEETVLLSQQDHPERFDTRQEILYLALDPLRERQQVLTV